MTTPIFAPALAALPPDPWSLYGPLSFQGYLAEHHLPAKDTAAMISINTEGQLPHDLREQQTMVFRLGRAANKPGTTQFALLRTPGRLADFFLLDHELFTSTTPETYIPASPPAALLPYHLFPKLTEKAAVNLAFASGLLGHALGLDQPYPTSAPATGAATATFSFRAHSHAPHVLTHNQGQVEVDASFIGRRQGQDCLFILESKAGPPASLAKQKLVYPTLLFTSTGRVPADMPIIPVYLRVQLFPGRIEYHFIQCRYPDPRANTPCLDTLTADPDTYRHLVLRLEPPGSTLG